MSITNNDIRNVLNIGSPLLLGRMAGSLARRPREDESWMGIAPIAHRVTVTTPLWLDVNVNVRVVPIFNIQVGQLESVFNEIVEQFFVEARQNVVDEWERSYFSNDGIGNAWVFVRQRFEALYAKYNDPEILDLMHYFPSERTVQTHTWWTILFPHVLGVRLLETRLISAIDFQNILFNGFFDPNGLRIQQTQDVQYMPRFGTLDIEEVDYIDPQQPPQELPDMVQRYYTTGFDMPAVGLTEIKP